MTQSIEDRHAIEDVLRQYCRGVDRGDVDLLRDVYHEDAIDDHGTFQGDGRAFAEHLVSATKDRWLASQHLLHQSNFDIDGDTAYVETYFTAHHRVRGETGGSEVLETFGGRYVDRLERRDGAWRIARRQVVHDWSRVQEIEQAYPNEAFTQGVRSRDDASYGR